MAKVEWKDGTSYSQSDKERVPRVWCCKIGKIDVCVHRHIHYEGWLLSSDFLEIEKFQLKYEDLELAKREALLALREVFASRVEQFQSYIQVIDKSV